MNSEINPWTEAIDEASMWGVGGGIVVTALAPLSLPILVLTIVALVLLAVPLLVVGLLATVVALPVVLLRKLGRATGRGLRRDWSLQQLAPTLASNQKEERR